MGRGTDAFQEYGTNRMIPPIDDVARMIADPNEDIVIRMRCLFYARHYGGEDAVKALLGGVGDPSVLLVYVIVS